MLGGAGMGGAGIYPMSFLSLMMFLQLVTTDRARSTMESKATSLTTFLAKLSRSLGIALLPKLKLYMKELKATMKPLNILQGEFAENFSYVVQDEIQTKFPL